MPDPAISIRGLAKHYGRLVAVSDLTLDVVAGEVFGFLGLNGAGKTTTIRVLLDLLRPTRGRASIFGRDCQADGLAARAATGYLPSEIGFYSDMTGEDTLRLIARLSRQRVDAAYRRRLEDRLEFASADLGRRLREYSGGMKRKLGIIQAFQADPPLLILDEPSEGLDPLMQEAFYDLLAEVKGRGRTVFLSSHVLPEVERVCDRVAVLRTGRLALVAAVDEIRSLAPRRVRVTFGGDVPFEPGLLPAAFTVIEIQPTRWSLNAQGPLGPLVTSLAGLPVEDIEVHEPRLEDILIRYYRDSS
ncbi:MAG: ABC transporter ATP-binding protein [Planctomycetes bacterium]|nr:ABC transporter ATP-binding protein [Planctomycetota bacterium]